MKLLFDQNISPKIVSILESDFPNSKQVRHLELENASDSLIFDFTRDNNFTIVTFDSDFVDLNIVRGIPPKIIWLKTGNQSTKSISEMLTKNIHVIQEFVHSENGEIFEILRTEL